MVGVHSGQIDRLWLRGPAPPLILSVRPIAGFAGGETLDLRSIQDGAGITTTLGYSGNTSSDTLTVSDGTRTASLSLTGTYTQPHFHLGTDTHGGTAITLV